MSIKSNRRRRMAARPKTVYVHRYSRHRSNRWEDVTDHFRSSPHTSNQDRLGEEA